LSVSITLNNLGKKFNREWIFRDLTCQVAPHEKLVILGGNGSGKSTLLQVISGFVTPNEGELVYRTGDVNVRPEKIKDLISFASPYLQLVEDFTLNEMLEHAAGFKPFINHYTAREVMGIVELENAENKPVKQFSSGMKQRLKLGMAILAHTPVVLLDEPVSNLDKNAIAWFRELINSYTKERTVIVCSNAIPEEYFFCERELDVSHFKRRPA
jgi:ABC-type multidrug transport system ATPase subunit